MGMDCLDMTDTERTGGYVYIPPLSVRYPSGQKRTGGQSVRFLGNNAFCNARLALKMVNLRMRAAN